MNKLFTKLVLSVVALCVLAACAQVQDSSTIDTSGTSIPKDVKSLEASIEARIRDSNAITEPLSPFLVNKPIGWSNVAVGGGGYITVSSNPSWQNSMVASLKPSFGMDLIICALYFAIPSLTAETLSFVSIFCRVLRGKTQLRRTSY
jgi:hypothetical protein